MGSPSDLALKTQFEGGIREVRYRLSGATDPIYKLTCSACESGGRDIYQFLPSRLTQAHKFGQFPRAASSLQQQRGPRTVGGSRDSDREIIRESPGEEPSFHPTPSSVTWGQESPQQNGVHVSVQKQSIFLNTPSRHSI